MKCFALAATALVFGVASSQAADICEAVALRNVHAVEDPTSMLKQGAHVTAVSQYVVDKKTGAKSFCSHGGYCYPVYVTVNGQQVEALQLTNCAIDKSSPYNSDDEIIYSVVVIPSLVSAATLKYDDLDNRLLGMGLCSACASNAADLYIDKPNSACGQLVKRALEGNPAAEKKLTDDFPDYCFDGEPATQNPLTFATSAGPNPAQAPPTARLSSAEKLVPDDFDRGHQYQTYSVGELYDAVVDTAGINNSFVGRQVKVLAKYDRADGSSGVSINRTRRAVLNSEACQLSLCDSMEPLMDMFDIKMEFLKVFNKLSLQAYFPESARYRQFLADAERVCSLTYPCAMWARGTLRYQSAEIKKYMIPMNARIVYLEVEEVRLYEGHDNALLYALKTGTQQGLRAAKFLDYFFK